MTVMVVRDRASRWTRDRFSRLSRRSLHKHARMGDAIGRNQRVSATKIGAGLLALSPHVIAVGFDLLVWVCVAAVITYVGIFVADTTTRSYRVRKAPQPCQQRHLTQSSALTVVVIEGRVAWRYSTLWYTRGMVAGIQGRQRRPHLHIPHSLQIPPITRNLPPLLQSDQTLNQPLKQPLAL